MGQLTDAWTTLTGLSRDPSLAIAAAVVVGGLGLRGAAGIGRTAHPLGVPRDALAVTAVGIATWATGEARPVALVALGWLLALPVAAARDRRVFAMISGLVLGLGTWNSASPVWILAPLCLGAVTDQSRSAPWGIHCIAAFGIWATVPDTEVARALLAAAAVLMVSELGSPRSASGTNRSRSIVFMALAVWAILRGARGRPFSALFAVMELGPVVWAVHRPHTPTWTIVAAQIGLIGIGVFWAHGLA